MTTSLSSQASMSRVIKRLSRAVVGDAPSSLEIYSHWGLLSTQDLHLSIPQRFSLIMVMILMALEICSLVKLCLYLGLKVFMCSNCSNSFSMALTASSPCFNASFGTDWIHANSYTPLKHVLCSSNFSSSSLFKISLFISDTSPYWYNNVALIYTSWLHHS